VALGTLYIIEYMGDFSAPFGSAIHGVWHRPADIPLAMGWPDLLAASSQAQT
jgi:hypothetical protein